MLKTQKLYQLPQGGTAQCDWVTLSDTFIVTIFVFSRDVEGRDTHSKANTPTLEYQINLQQTIIFFEIAVCMFYNLFLFLLN